MPDDKRSFASEASRAAKGWDTQFESLLAVNERAYRNWVSGVSAFADEVAQFTKARLNEGAESWQMLAACKTPIEALECQRRYADKAAGQYFEQAKKLTQLAVDIASNGLSSMQSVTGELTRTAKSAA
jgi:hypothetical protein